MLETFRSNSNKTPDQNDSVYNNAFPKKMYVSGMKSSRMFDMMPSRKEFSGEFCHRDRFCTGVKAEEMPPVGSYHVKGDFGWEGSQGVSRGKSMAVS